MNGYALTAERDELLHCGQRGKRATQGLLIALAAALVVGLAASSGSSAAIGTVYTVDTTAGDSDVQRCQAGSDCSLADAILAANANPGKDTIGFNISGAGPHLIVLPPSPLPPAITEAVVIDGLSQGGPGYAGSPLIEIDIKGSLLVVGIPSGGTEIRGLAIHGGPTSFSISNSSGNVVADNFIGVNVAGSALAGRGSSIVIDGPSAGNTIENNLIAGNDGGERIHLDSASPESSVTGTRIVGNLIGINSSGVGLSMRSGVGIMARGGGHNEIIGNVISDQQHGIWISGHTGLPSSDNRIEGNLIGMDITGKSAVPNEIGVHMGGLTSGNVIGGSALGAQNVISGNTGAGVSIWGGSDTIIQGNFIGTDRTGELDRGNGNGIGVTQIPISPTTDVLVADNVVSGNTGDGIFVNPGVTSVRIEGNRVGTDKDGSEPIPNGGYGVKANMNGGAVGGASVAQRNVISANLEGGVYVGGSDVKVLNNYIGTTISGDLKLGNGRDSDGGDGVEVGGVRTTIGLPGAGNVIADNGTAGVRLSKGATSVQGNLIGTDATGEADFGNGGAGVLGLLVHGGTVIGGSSSSEQNLISGNGGWGIELLDSFSDTLIRGNHIGTDDEGVSRIPNELGGVRALTEAVIEANLISGNDGDGISVETDTRIAGNRVGTDASGNGALANDGDGIQLHSGSTVVGGSGTDRNVISGNTGNGLLLLGEGNKILGNLIGTDIDGEAEVPNALSGVRLQGSNTLEDNVVSGNGVDGVEITSDQNTVLRNRIGTGVDGTTSLGNGRHGISIDNGANTIGADGASNTIAFNRGHGVWIDATNIRIQRNSIHTNGGDGVAVVQGRSTRNTISRNSIFANGGLGIDLEDNGVTPNDLGDPDSGANLRQNFPIVTSVAPDGMTIFVALNSRPNSTYSIELFETIPCDPSGNGEGETFLAAVSAVTDATGNWTDDVPLTSSVTLGSVVTGTATDSVGNTSEFSQCKFPPEATLVVEKRTLPTGASDEFEFTGDVAGRIGDGGTIPLIVRPGTYTSTEIVPAGWDLSSVVCDDSDSKRDPGSATATFRVVDGDRVKCTFTNTKRGTITVPKRTVPAGDPALFQFQSGLESLGIIGDGQSLFRSVPPGDYPVREVVPAGWDLTAIACDDADSSSSVVGATATFRVSAGEAVSCEFVNTKRGTIVVEKQTIPDGASGNFVFTGDVAGTISDHGRLIVPNLKPGAYRSTENGSGAAFRLASIQCSEPESGGDLQTRTATYDLDPGETITCTFTNEAQVPPTPPGCSIVAQGKDSTGHGYIGFRAQSAFGLLSYKVIYTRNASVAVDSFMPGTTEPVFVTARAIDPAKSLGVTVEFVDIAGNRLVCDPIVYVVTRITDQPQDETFTDLPQAESKVTILNGDPGMRKVRLVVNGVKFKEVDLRAGEVRRFDVASAMRPGIDNTITVRARGKKGASAVIVIADIP